MLIDEKGQTLVTLMEVQENAWTWQEYHKDLNLSPHAGQTINLRFNVHNDGVGGHRSFMYVDDVTLRVCQ